MFEQMIAETYRDVAEIVLAARPRRPSARTGAYDVVAAILAATPGPEDASERMTPEEGDLYGLLLCVVLEALPVARPLAPKRQRDALDKALERATRLREAMHEAMTPVAEFDFEGIWEKG